MQEKQPLQLTPKLKSAIRKKQNTELECASTHYNTRDGAENEKKKRKEKDF